MNHELLAGFSKYLSVPFKDKGRDPYGWDCWGLVYWISKDEFGRKIPSYTEAYSTTEVDASVQEAIMSNRPLWKMIELNQAIIGDVVVFNLAGKPLHCGLVLEPNIMIHCMEGRGTVLEEYTNNVWHHRIEGIYRWIS